VGSEEEPVVGGDWGAIDEFEYCEGTAIDDYFCAVGEFGKGPWDACRYHRCLRERICGTCVDRVVKWTGVGKRGISSGKGTEQKRSRRQSFGGRASLTGVLCESRKTILVSAGRGGAVR